MSVSLLEVAREVYEASGNPNRSELIDEIIDKIPAEDRAEALRDALRRLIPQFTITFRRQAMAPRRVEPTGKNYADYSGNVEVLPGGTREVRVPYLSAYAARWKTFLAQTIPTERGEHIFLREARLADIRWQATSRQLKAKDLIGQADIWNIVGDRFEKSGVEKMGQMPESNEILNLLSLTRV